MQWSHGTCMAHATSSQSSQKIQNLQAIMSSIRCFVGITGKYSNYSRKVGDFFISFFSNRIYWHKKYVVFRILQSNKPGFDNRHYSIA